jgi:hypothetical protein
VAIGISKLLNPPQVSVPKPISMTLNMSEQRALVVSFDAMVPEVVEASIGDLLGGGAIGPDDDLASGHRKIGSAKVGGKLH